MLVAIIIILFVLWLLGFAPLSGISIPNFALFTINSHVVTLWEVLILAVVVWAIGILPRPFQLIASILLLLWIISLLGILAITGLSNVIILAIIIALIVSFFL